MEVVQTDFSREFWQTGDELAGHVYSLRHLWSLVAMVLQAT